MWYLLWCDHDKSYSLIHQKYVMSVDELQIGSEVQFFYSNKPYFGKITEMDEDREVVDAKLRALGETAKRTTKKAPAQPAPVSKIMDSNRSRRSANPATTNNRAPVKQKDSGVAIPEFKGKKLLEMNRKISAMRENKNLMEKVERKKNARDVDDDWFPGDPEHQPAKDKPSRKRSKSSSDEDDSSLANVVKRNKERAAIGSLVKGIKHLDQDDILTDTSNSTLPESDRQTIVSPSKEDLKKKLAEYESRLKFLSGSSPKNKSSEVPSTTVVKDLLKHGNMETPLEEKSGMSNDSPSDVNHDNGDTLDLNRSSASIINAVVGEEEDDDDSSDLNKEQLFGECKDTVKIGKGIFCKRDVLKKALSASTEITHIARRLIEGVFKMESIVKCTLTGMPYRAGGKEKMADVDGLDRTAVEAIIGYAREIGKIRIWTPVKTKVIRTSMTQRLGELKRQSNE